MHASAGTNAFIFGIVANTYIFALYENQTISTDRYTPIYVLNTVMELN